jgi:hypothetical protein
MLIVPLAYVGANWPRTLDGKDSRQDKESNGALDERLESLATMAAARHTNRCGPGQT